MSTSRILKKKVHMCTLPLPSGLEADNANELGLGFLRDVDFRLRFLRLEALPTIFSKYFKNISLISTSRKMDGKNLRQALSFV